MKNWLAKTLCLVGLLLCVSAFCLLVEDILSGIGTGLFSFSNEFVSLCFVFGFCLYLIGRFSLKTSYKGFFWIVGLLCIFADVAFFSSLHASIGTQESIGLFIDVLFVATPVWLLVDFIGISFSKVKSN